MAAAVVLAIVVVELSFRLAGFLLAHEPTAPGGSGRIVVLAVGDSHTWGGGRGYPSKLGELLAERSPRYAVVNLGVPGTNTAQTRNRFIHYLDLYQPRVVVHWAGINNTWNLAERNALVEDEPAYRRLVRRFLAHSRIVRFLRAWRNQARIESLIDGDAKPVLSHEKREGERKAAFRRRFADREDAFPTVAGNLDWHSAARATEQDLRWMAERARERGVGMVLVTYALPGPSFTAANRGIIDAAEATGVPLLQSGEGIRRLVERHAPEPTPKGFDRTAHPTQALYDEVARMILETLDAENLL